MKNKISLFVIISVFVIASVSVAISPLYSESKVIAVLPFENLHKKSHLEFVKNIVHEKLFTELGSTNVGQGFSPAKEATEGNPFRDNPEGLSYVQYIIIGIASLDDAKQLYKISKGKVPTVVLQGEYFMIRDRLALNISLLNPKDGSRIDGTGELVVYKGNRHPELSGQANFQQSIYEDIQEPLNKLIEGIKNLLEKPKK
ncbi:MAG: hypothetical protein WC947_10790 [Elusimicrobiota bacterium]